MQKISTLNRKTLMFPLAIVLFEFCTYIANDMIQPGMIAVIREYHAGVEWVARSLTAYLIGGTLITWLLGPLSDRIGRRPVMIFGAAVFALSLLLILFSWNIETFMLWRIVQGMGLCYILAVGYAAIQEGFEEKAAVKVMAMMANVALLAPLVGPVLGAAVVSVWSWQVSFVLIAVVVVLSVIALYFHMPETMIVDKTKPASPISFKAIWTDYRTLLAEPAFVKAAACMSLFGVPLIVWIGLSPVILIKDAGMTPMEYGLCQIPVIGALVVGNVLLMKVTDRWPIARPVQWSPYFVALGLVLTAPVFVFPEHAAWFITLGMTCFAFAQGFAFAVVYRFVMTSSPQGAGVMGAAVGMVLMAGYALELELAAWLYYRYAGQGLFVMLLIFCIFFFILLPGVIKRAVLQREPTDITH
ncbi:MdfA family multidrug efflux MFS transporter [Aquirhabdus parva]|uniref:Multidrug transporter MdfA n=1 Tax=Aquirhabdus parva TaxID=2283318 RepID=A0A345P815_9GAMM|nr:MdfA family multidrug efflux MFS transporter [Aquirhabdus parva]AXI03424.1 multidrug transporter MdfA [Aquirhabdus parva]